MLSVPAGNSSSPQTPRCARGSAHPVPWEERAAERLQQVSLPRLPPRSGLTVMFPAYNDAPTIGTLVDFAAALLPRVADAYEIIVVNDGSGDDTTGVLAERAARYPFLKVIHHATNQGYGAALRSGFAAASQEWIFYTDGDGQYDPTELVALLPHAGGCGMVNGYKRQRSDSWTRILIGRMYHHVARFLFRLRIRDIDCDFRLIRRDALRLFALTSPTGAICTELVRKMQQTGHVIREVPVHHYERVNGRSQFFRFHRIVASLWMLLGLWNRLVLQPKIRQTRQRLRLVRDACGPLFLLLLLLGNGF